MRLQLLAFIVAVGLCACMVKAPAATSSGELSPAAAAAQRAGLTPKISNFLSQVAALEPARLQPRLEYPTTGLLAGWREKVCLRVSGLPAKQGKYVRSRISEIARTAGVRLAEEPCSPNLYVAVTSRPTQLLKVMAKQNAIGAYGARGRPYLLDQFIANTSPVKAWYDVYAGAAVTFEFTFSGVFVIADQSKLHGVSLGQLADYAAMVGLAEIRPDAHPDNAPTILKLFDGVPQAAPARMTSWDRAFLKSLYSTGTWPHPWQRLECDYAQQCEVDRIALNMVSQLVP